MSKAVSTITTAAPPLPSTSRRRLLAGSGLATIAAAVWLPAMVPAVAPVTSPDHPDAVLLATFAVFADLTASIHRLNAASGCDWDELTAINMEWHNVLEDLSDMQPTTLAGFQAKAQAVIIAFQLDVPAQIGTTVEEAAEPHEYAAWQLLQDVVQMEAIA